MAVPIVNVKVGDIITELGEQIPNIAPRNLHRSPKVRGIGIDPVFCGGDSPYERLYSLQKDPTIGKFRNYEQFDFSYRGGLMYGGDCIYPRSSSIPKLHIPTGWRIPTQQDWNNILQAIQPGSNFTNNTAAHHLRCSYNRTDIINFNNLYYQRTGFWLIKPGKAVPIFEDSILKSDTYNFKAIASSFIDVFAANSIGSNWFCWSFSDSVSSNTFTLPCVTLNGNFNYPEAFTTATVGYKFQLEAFNGRWVMMPIRLVKNDSNNPGFLEDIEGNIYQTIKIGNTVIMAEGYRCTRNENNQPIVSYIFSMPIPEVPYYFADSLISDMP